MRRFTCSLFVLSLLLLSAPAVAQTGEKGGDSNPNTEASPRLADQSPDALAKRVVATSGDPATLSELEFSFVVEKDGNEVSRRHHDWRPRAGELTITADDKEYKFAHLHDYNLSKLAKAPDKNAQKWQEIAPELSPKEAAEAWAWFINDSYWLLMPTKLMDNGVHRKMDEQGRLVLSFGQVGMTPGDTYALTVDPKTAQINAWQFELQSGKKGNFVWSDYKKVGPLTLSTLRTAKNAKMAIRFDKLRAQK